MHTKRCDLLQFEKMSAIPFGCNSTLTHISFVKIVFQILILFEKNIQIIFCQDCDSNIRFCLIVFALPSIASAIDTAP